MSLIETFSGHHLLSVDIQPDETYFLKSLDAGEVERMDEVMKAFRKGDTEALGTHIEKLRYREQAFFSKMSIELGIKQEYKDPAIIAILKRLQKAAAAMEAECH